MILRSKETVLVSSKGSVAYDPSLLVQVVKA